MQQRFEYFASFLFSRGLKNLEIMILVILLVWGYCSDLLSVGFHPDETFWIVSSVRMDKFLALEFNDQIWSNDPLMSYEVRPISSYFVAIGQKLGGLKTDSLTTYWDWESSFKENVVRGAFPSSTVLWWSRLPMAVISVFSMLSIVLMLAEAHSRMAAYIFTLVSLNDYFMVQLRRALSEPALLFFTVLALYASCRLLVAVQRKSTGKVILWSVMAGLLSGLAGESKLTGWACVAITILGMMILLTGDRSNLPGMIRSRIPLISTLIVLGTSYLTFIASFPFFYQDTLSRIVTTFATRNQVMQYQIYRYANVRIQPSDRLTILFQRIFSYPVHLTTNNTIITWFHWINLILTLFGIYYCVRRVMQKSKDREYALVFLLGALVCAVPMLLTPLDWERYYLYPIFFSCIFFSFGIAELLWMWILAAQKQKANKLDEWKKYRHNNIQPL